MYFKAYFQTQCLVARHGGKMKRNQPRPQKINYRPLKVRFILGSNFQMPEDTRFICTNNSTQVLTTRYHAAIIPLRKETRSVSQRGMDFGVKSANHSQNNSKGPCEDAGETGTKVVLWSDETKQNCLAIMTIVVFGGKRGRLASQRTPS